MPAIPHLFDLTGRVAVVTGGSRGLGLEIAEGLGEAGASLVLCARRAVWLTPTVEAPRTAGMRVEGIACDVAVPEQAQGVVDLAVREFGEQRRNQLRRRAGGPSARQVAAGRPRPRQQSAIGNWQSAFTHPPLK